GQARHRRDGVADRATHPRSVADADAPRMVRLARLGYFMGLSRTGPPALFTSESAVEARLDRSEWQRVYEECFPRVFRALVAVGARHDEAEDDVHDALEQA